MVCSAMRAWTQVPLYGMPEPTLTRPRFCALHKTEGMIDLKNLRCDIDGCKKKPLFAPP
jgi:EsV-1-7 cysteine-rich motif